MRILVKSTTRHELILNDEGETTTGQIYSDIPDVLEDETADDYEKTRTIVEIMSGACPDSSASDYDVFVFNDIGALTFTGSMSCGISRVLSG